MKEIKLNITAIPNSQNTVIKYIDEHEIRMSVNQAPENNKANLEVIKYLSKLLKINKKDIKIISGSNKRHKLVSLQVEDNSEDIIEILKRTLNDAE